MHKRDTEQVGICHKLFSMIVNTIIARGIKRLTTGPTTVSDSVEVPLDGSTKNGHIQVSVDTNHKYGIENWVSFENRDSPIQEKESLISRSDDHHEIVEEKNSQSKDKMPMVHKKDDSESKARESRKSVNINGVENGTDKMNAPPRTMWHLFSVDEKSDEFIRKKKEAMRKNYSLDHPR